MCLSGAQRVLLGSVAHCSKKLDTHVQDEAAGRLSDCTIQLRDHKECHDLCSKWVWGPVPKCYAVNSLNPVKSLCVYTQESCVFNGASLYVGVSWG